MRCITQSFGYNLDTRTLLGGREAGIPPRMSGYRYAMCRLNTQRLSESPSLPELLKQLTTRQLFLATLMHSAKDEELMGQMRPAASTFERVYK